MESMVIKELVGNYDVTQEQAKLLVKKHRKLIESAEFLGSKPYYPAQQIANAEGLNYNGKLDSQLEERSED